MAWLPRSSPAGAAVCMRDVADPSDAQDYNGIRVTNPLR